MVSSRHLIPALCALSLSLVACVPAPSTGSAPTPSPTTVIGPTVQPSGSPGASSTPTTSSDLLLRLEADPALAAFRTQQTSSESFSLCLNRLARVRTRLNLSSALEAPTRNQLTQAGFELSGDAKAPTLTITRDADFAALLAGIELRVSALPGSVEGRTAFLDAAGSELGFVSWEADVDPATRQVTVTLAPDASARPGESCPLLRGRVSGARFSGAGGQVQPGQPLPNPASSPTLPNSPVPPGSPAPGSIGAPSGAQVVEQTSTSLTLQWDFGGEAGSYALYLDGRDAVANHTSPNYYRFEGLTPGTSYRLGVQAVAPDGSRSEIVTVASATLLNGRTAQGNFSSTGSGGGRSHPSASPSPVIREEFLVNTNTTLDQQSSAVAMSEDGDFVVIWQSRDQDGSGTGIYGQRYNADGSAAGSEFRVNTYTTGAQGFHAVAMSEDGDFVVTWISGNQDGDSYGIYGQRYDADGSVAGSEFRVNSYTTGTQYFPDVAMNEDGDFIVTWVSDGQDGNSFGIYGQRYNANGSVAGSEFRVNTYTTGPQVFPDVAMNDDGDFVVTWTSGDQDDGADGGIYGQRYKADGSVAGDEFLVNTYTTGLQALSAVAMSEDGDFVVTWVSDGQDGNGFGIYGQRYAANGSVAGSEFSVNTTITSNQRDPAVAMSDDGDFVVTWRSDDQDGDAYGVYGQRYTARGRTDGSEFRVNTYTIQRQSFPAVAMSADGDFVVTWQSNDQDGSSYGIYGHYYENDD